MTITPAEALLSIALDMTASLPAADRSQRLVEAVARALPCDAVVLLRLDGQELLPQAWVGLAGDVAGRRFRRAEHPRLEILCRAPGPTRFPADSRLPDPYDGLVGDQPELRVHSCLGCPLRIEGHLVGVLTVDALRPGAFDGVDEDFLTQLSALTAAALRTGDLIEALEQAARHHGQVASDLVQNELHAQGGMLLGTGPALTRLRHELELIASTDLPVLVSGETGVGKELAVRSLHAHSRRADRPLIYVNCAALPESVVESELFGHVKGAFTGAVSERAGKFRVAHGASLFLDEIGELPLAVQPKLLRILQQGELQAVGSDRTQQVDVRLFAATNRDLPGEVRAGRFRADLLHRLDVARLRLPALREHPEDIPLLLGHFADRARRRLGSGPIRIAPEAREALVRAAWPGNVRELENTLYRAVLRALPRVQPGGSVVLRLEDFSGLDDQGWQMGVAATGSATGAKLGEHMVGARGTTALVRPIGGEDERELGNSRGSSGSGVSSLSSGADGLRERTRAFQRATIEAALAQNAGNWAAAARSLGLQRGNLHHFAKRLGLR